MPESRAAYPRKKHPLLSLAAVGALALGGLAAGPAASAAPGDTCSSNPMGAATPIGAEHGYTVFTSSDATLANSELEGSLAVGGTATFWHPRGNPTGQYPIVHKIAGNADYALPEIDGAPSRVLLNAYSPGVESPATATSTGKVVQLKDVGRPASVAGPGLATIVSPAVAEGPYTFRQSFETGGTTFFPVGGGNQSPQFDSHVQPWANQERAEDSFGASGTFGSYFAADRGAATLGAVTGWLVPTITGAAPGAEATITLGAAGPNRITLAELNNTTKFMFGPDTVLDPCAPLIVTVGSSDLEAGTVTLPSFAHAGNSALGEGISYILWDLSSLSGDVTVTAPDAPVRGAIYAPDAHIIFPPEADGGREFEGQIIARQLSALQGGKEIHTNLFKGLLPAAPAGEGGPIEPGAGGGTGSGNPGNPGSGENTGPGNGPSTGSGTPSGSGDTARLPTTGGSGGGAWSAAAATLVLLGSCGILFSRRTARRRSA